MSVRTDYRVEGLHSSQIRELQKELGVKADGAWGKISQAALDALYGEESDPYAVYAEKGVEVSTVDNKADESVIPLSGDAASSSRTITHMSGYTGNVYTDDHGRVYTSYGALLRTDGFFYPKDAKISPNGMYYDVGNGWQFAKKAVSFDTNLKFLGYVDSSVTGLAPGTPIPEFTERDV